MSDEFVCGIGECDCHTVSNIPYRVTFRPSVTVRTAVGVTFQSALWTLTAAGIDTMTAHQMLFGALMAYPRASHDSYREHITTVLARDSARNDPYGTYTVRTVNSYA